MKQLINAATSLSIIAILIFLAVEIVTGYATVSLTNELAIDQLNGGDTAYITSQVWYDFRNILTYLGYSVTATAIALIITIIFKVLKERNK